MEEENIKRRHVHLCAGSGVDAVHPLHIAPHSQRLGHAFAEKKCGRIYQRASQNLYVKVLRLFTGHDPTSGAG